MKIENAQQEFFNSKEEYLQFRQAWKDYINSGKAKKVEKTYHYSGELYRESNLRCVHHLIYGLLRGRDTSQMLSLTLKVQGQRPYFPFYEARSTISLAIQIADRGPSKLRPEGDTGHLDRLNALLEPFGNTIDIETLKLLMSEISDWDLDDE